MSKRMSCRSLIVPALLAGALLTAGAAQAQGDAPNAPVSLDVSNAPVQIVLRSLFTSAGVRNFTIASDVQGAVNVSLSGVPFSLALRQVLSAASPPLAFDVLDGVYQVRLKTAAPPAALPPTVAVAASAEDAGPDRFYKIGVKHYDAGMMADLATRPGGIILVPPNFVIPANPGAVGGIAGPTVTTVTSQPQAGNPAAPASVPLANNALPNNALPNNVLPEGVKRIYALASDNSLVIEATPSGLARLPFVLSN